MKILFYINTLSHGGAERVMSELASAFACCGEEVILVTSFRMQDEYRLNEKVQRLSIEDDEVRQSRLRRNVSRIRALRAICKQRTPDVVISFMLEPNFRALIATLGLPCRTVVSVRNDPAHEYAGLLGAMVGKALMPVLSDGCVFQTEQAREWFPARLRRKSAIIPNAVAGNFFKCERSGNDSYWVAIGRLVAQKDYPTMLRAFRRVLDSYPEERLRIYGSGSLDSELCQEIQNLGIGGNVALCGQTDDVAGALADAKGFLMSSLYEGMPNVLMEAMAMGLPCIVTDCPCGGPAELIENGVSGVLVHAGDEVAMAEKICGLIESPELQRCMGGSARKAAYAYEPGKTFARWEKYIKSVADKR